MQIEDVQNLGALLRSALFLGADGVLLSAHNTAPVSAACAKASAGASELWLASGRLLSAGRFADTLDESAAAGWQVLGAAAAVPSPPAAATPSVREQNTTEAMCGTGNSSSCSSHTDDTAQDAQRDSLLSNAPPTILVLGNEGGGLTDDTRRACTGLVGIADRQQEWALDTAQGGVAGIEGFFLDSLNVSAAGAVLLNQCARKKFASSVGDER